MEMNAPFYKFGLFGDGFSLIVAFVIGIGFGFFLERAGFGSPGKLMGQFYLTDLAVFKVMFTAIVTAVLGLFYMGWLGLVDMSLVYIPPTYLLPQIVGGLILGVGFVVGGYCPGTSCVGVASGRVDAIVFLIGLMAGIFVFGEFHPVIESFYNETAMGQVTLPEIFKISYGLIVLAVVLIAVGGFAGASRVEKIMAAKKGEPQP